MKNLLVFSVAFVLVLSIVSCQKKGDSSAIKPDYSATGNPNPNNQTVTGSTTYSNPAMNNSSLLVGNAGWSNLTCASTASAVLKGTNGTTDITLNFPGPAVAGNYAIAASPGTGACAMTILNAPNQPAGLVWYGKNGTVEVYVSAGSINARFTNVVCTQQTFNFPTVAASGTVSCN